MPCWSGEGLRRDLPRAWLTSPTFLCPVGRARGCDPVIWDLYRTVFGGFYALLVGRGVATVELVLNDPTRKSFYALLVGRGVATKSAMTRSTPSVSMPCWSGEGLRHCRRGKPGD